MKRNVDAWWDIGLPIVASMGTFCFMNLLWSVLGLYKVPPALAVYMLGSLVALAFLARAIHRGTLTAEELGLGSGGWQPGYRLYGLVLTVLIVTFLYTTAETKAPLQFGDYCFWFYFLLQASLAELLIFLSVGYCLPARWLRERGWPAWQVVLLAGLFAGVTFGWHHYTGEPKWHKYSWVTIPVMWINLLYFIPTRNFQLTLLLHNAIAAVGFTQEEYLQVPPEHWQDPATYNTPFYIAVFIVSFAVPYLLLHGLEWWATAVGADARTGVRVKALEPRPSEAT